MRKWWWLAYTQPSQKWVVCFEIRNKSRFNKMIGNTRKRGRCMRATRMPSAVPLTTKTTNKKKLSTSMMSEQFYPSSSSSASSSISKSIDNSSSSMQEEQKNVENDTDDDEYNRAVAFLRDFHSKRVACFSPLMQTPLHLSSLDSILENDDADEQHQQQRQNQLENLLSSDFSLALNVGSSSGSGSSSVDGSSSTTQLAQSSISPYQSRLKKVANSECLLSLVEDDTTSQCPSMVLSTSDSELSSSSATSIDSSTSSSSSSSLSCSSSSCVGTNQEVWFPMIW